MRGNVTEKRRVGFLLPPEVYEQLLDEVMYADELESGREANFWEQLRSYYQLSPLQGDTCICGPGFLEFVSQYSGSDPPAWVFDQGSLRKMQCMVVAGEGRGGVLLETLKAIEQAREQEEWASSSEPDPEPESTQT